jgi:exopolysaccharide production protein ExoQ
VSTFSPGRRDGAFLGRAEAAAAIRRASTAAPLGFVALAVGILAVQQPFAAVAVVVGVALVALIAARIEALPLVLVATLFVESIAVGGQRIGRLAAVMALFLVLYYLLVRGTAGLRPNLLLAAVSAYGLWIFASFYWAGDPAFVYDTFFRYLLVFAYMAAFAVIVRTPGQVLAIFVTLSVGALVFGVLSFGGYAASVDVYSTDVDPGKLGQSASGLQGDHNLFAVYQVLALPAALTVAALARRAVWMVFAYTVVAVVVLSVVASLSRTALLMLAVVVGATLVAPSRVFFRRANDKLNYFFAILVAGALVAFAGAAPFVKRALTIFHEQGVSGARGSGRIDLWRAAWGGFREHTLTGLGAGNFRAQSADLLQTTPGVENVLGNPKLSNKFVHNMYLGNLTELGIVGFGLFMAVLLLTVWYLLGTVRRARALDDRRLERLSAALIVTLIGYAVAGFFLSLELSKPLFIIIGLALALDVMSRRAVVAARTG